MLLKILDLLEIEGNGTLSKGRTMFLKVLEFLVRIICATYIRFAKTETAALGAIKDLHSKLVLVKNDAEALAKKVEKKL